MGLISTWIGPLPPSLLFASIVKQQHAFAFLGRKQDDAGCLQCSTNQIARRFVHIKSVFGLKTL